MSDETRAREFWINDNAEGDGSKSWSESPWFGFIHVIEFKAYESEKARADRLEETLASIKRCWSEDKKSRNEAWDSITQLAKENDELKSKLLKCLKDIGEIE